MSTARKNATALHRLLMERFPQAFPKDYDALLPLKLDIDADLRARLIEQGEPVDPDLLRRVLANHTGRAGYLLALLHRPGGQRYDLDGRPAGEVDARAHSEAVRLLGAHQKRQQEAAARRCQHLAMEQQQQAAKAARIAEREQRAAEKQRRCEENERNRLRNLERKAAEQRAREAMSRSGGPLPLPAVSYRKRWRVDPKDRKD
jgi:sRNA-binding protein